MSDSEGEMDACFIKHYRMNATIFKYQAMCQNVSSDNI